MNAYERLGGGVRWDLRYGGNGGGVFDECDFGNVIGKCDYADDT